MSWACTYLPNLAFFADGVGAGAPKDEHLVKKYQFLQFSGASHLFPSIFPAVLFPYSLPSIFFFPPLLPFSILSPSPSFPLLFLPFFPLFIPFPPISLTFPSLFFFIPPLSYHPSSLPLFNRAVGGGKRVLPVLR